MHVVHMPGSVFVRLKAAFTKAISSSLTCIRGIRALQPAVISPLGPLYIRA